MGGVLIAVAGIWVLAQLLFGDVLGRLGVINVIENGL